MRKIKCKKCNEVNNIADNKTKAYCSGCGELILSEGLSEEEKKELESMIVVNNTPTHKENSIPIIIIFIVGGFLIALLVLSMLKYGDDHIEPGDGSGYEYEDQSCEKITDKDVIMNNVFKNSFKYKGYFESNDNDELYMHICKAKREDFNKIVKELKENGFNVEDTSEEADITDAFLAYKGKNYYVDVTYFNDDNYIEIMAIKYKKMEKIKWPTFGIALNVPAPSSTVGYINNDSSEYFSATLDINSKDEYEAYVEAVKAAGFIHNYSTGKYYYSAENDKEYTVTVTYHENNTLDIEIDEPFEDDDEVEDEDEDFDETTPVVVPNYNS